ncbi:TPA: hypothetical protein NJY08_005110 [Salmonella enterica subsp. enterica serovar Typhi str. AG3]|nr:hypothetical protein [Salmonella enterica subsp. enterica serovar Typhi str. AG3]
MIDQLSIFEFELEKNLNKTINTTIKPVEKESIDLENALEIVPNTVIEDLEAQSITEPYIGQKAKIIVPTDKSSELYQYLHAYFPKSLSKVGEIEEIKLYPSGKYTCIVNFFGDRVPMNLEDLLLFT